ncbi:hypothetical protein [Cohnella silvisoli]|uniref:Lipoprotein n=1 Tax=Cohnella silvisoli TaxID=2873699 RepID=A0ABV1L2H6_9BACL|nr:hypothetical protein [Cohnella silvisoli]MCD9025314.1 hypothetical protein [Cohnella silvisoli]
MNRLIAIIVCAAFMILTTGCGALFNAIEKDTVMVKKITKEHESNEVKYEGVLSQDTVKTLSLNAVNKYYDEKLTMDEVQFELMAVDQKKLKDLLVKVEYGINSRQKQNLGFKVDSQTEPNKIPSGLFYMTLTQSADPNEVYDIVLNARDGDVLKISKVILKNGSLGKEPKVVMDDIIGIANRFIQEKGSYALSDLVLNEKAIRWGIFTEMYYMSKDNQSLNYSVLVDLRTKQVVGFNKDVMAMLNYIGA